MMQKNSWKDSIWFFDIDDTIIDTAGASATAAEGIKQVFADNFDEDTAAKIFAKFNQVFELMLSGYRVKQESDWEDVPGGQEAFNSLLSYIEDHQIQVKQEFGQFKKWSREVFIKKAADDLGLQVTPELVHEAADGYWNTLTENTTVFPGAKELLDAIHEHQRPVFLITSSDARLKMLESGQFEYIPEYSEGLKRQRIEMLRDKGVDFRLVSIGDPEDKPHKDFFIKGIKLAEADLGEKIELNNAIMLGDSYGGDLETPKNDLGFGLAVLFEKGRTDADIMQDNLFTTCDLARVVSLFG